MSHREIVSEPKTCAHDHYVHFFCENCSIETQKLDEWAEKHVGLGYLCRRTVGNKTCVRAVRVIYSKKNNCMVSIPDVELAESILCCLDVYFQTSATLKQ